jgi:nitroreductase
MEYDSILELVKNTRSIRRFKPDPIPDEYIDKVIEVARWAPSGFNQQPWDFIVVKKPELKLKILEFCGAYGAQSAQMEIARESWQKGPKWEPGRRDSDFSVAPVFIFYAVIPEQKKDCQWRSGMTKHAFKVPLPPASRMPFSTCI